MIPPRRFSARTVLGGLLAASVLGAGVALAAEHAGSTPSQLSLVQAAATATPTPTAKPHEGAPGGFGGLGAGQILSVITKDTGLTPMQIVQDIGKGQTLQQIAGSNAAKVKTDVLAAIKTALDSAVTKGVITSDQETTLLKDAGDAIDVLMTANLSKLGLSGGLGHPGALPNGGGQHQRGPQASESPEPSESAEPSSATPSA